MHVTTSHKCYTSNTTTLAEGHASFSTTKLGRAGGIMAFLVITKFHHSVMNNTLIVHYEMRELCRNISILLIHILLPQVAQCLCK